MAAENEHLARKRERDRRWASMRPRRMAAENVRAPPPACCPPRSFNEAAAHGRGKYPDIIKSKTLTRYARLQ